MRAIAIVAAVVATAACVPGGRSKTRLPPRAKAKDPPAAAMPTDTPLTHETLARARFVFVTTAPPIDEPLPERLAKDAPAIVSHVIDAHDGGQIAPKDLAELRRLAFGRKAPPDDRSVRVSADALVEAGWDPPARAIWLVGPDGPCPGTIGDGFVGTYDDRRILEIAWEVAGCPAGEWAQVGIVVARLPPGLRWVPAQTLVVADLEHGKPWNHALAQHVPAPIAPEGQRPPERDLVRVRAVPGTRPMATQILSAQQWWREAVFDHHGVEAIREISDRCLERELRAQVRGAWGEDGFVAFADDPFGASFPVLVGALVEDEATLAILWRTGTEGVLTVAAPTDGDATRWVATRLRLGWWPPEAAATWDWTSGPRCAT